MARTERIEFDTAAGSTIVGRVEKPDGEVRAAALFAHCFTCSKDLKAVVRISRALARQGIAVLRFDFTGLGESGGEFARTDFGSNVADLVAAADFMERELGGAQILVGHSLGGAAVLAAAAKIAAARAVVTVAAPSDTAHLRDLLLRRSPELEESESVELSLGGRTVEVGRELLEDLERTDLEPAIRDLGLPLLILHSPVDETVAIDHAARIYETARHPKSFVSLDGADHLLLERDEDSRFVAGIIAAWSQRYVDREDGREAPTVQPGDVLVRGGRGFTQAVSTARHRLVADEPEEVGGDDLGPSPYELLLASLAACKSMTVRMYADRKGWPLDAVEVRARHGRIHAEDCADCVTEEGRIDRIEVELSLAGELDEEQRDRLREIADRCPVHRTLTSETRIVTAAGD